jgi:hypothetical protein
MFIIIKKNKKNYKKKKKIHEQYCNVMFLDKQGPNYKMQ